MKPNDLHTEIETYISKKDELLGIARGKFVLIKHDKIVGIFENQVDAINRGFEDFGNHPFLVRQVLDVEPPINFQFGDLKTCHHLHRHNKIFRHLGLSPQSQ